MHGQSTIGYPVVDTLANQSVSKLDNLLASPASWSEMPDYLMEYLHYPISVYEKASEGAQRVEGVNSNFIKPVILDMEVVGISQKKGPARRRAFKTHKMATQ